MPYSGVVGFLKKLFGNNPASETRVIINGKEVDPTQLGKQGVDLGALIQQAKDLQAHYAQQPQATTPQELMAQMAAANPGEPKATFVKKVNCHNCGGAKVKPSKTAYVYCDFCGGLTDYDFQKACENPQASMPGPAYEQLVRSLQDDTQAALQTKDRDRYLDIQRQIFEKWIELCPNAVSPRAKSDDEYRKGLVDYMAQTAVVNNFDSKYQEYAKQVAEQTRLIQWTGAFPKTTASSETFWPLYKTVVQQLDYSFSLLKEAGILDLHPDQAPESLQRKLTVSMFCQGWIPWLGTEDAEKMIADSGVKGEYSVMEPKELTLRHCGQCGGELDVVPGAKAVLCEDCGTRIDCTSDEVGCKNCGGQISFPVGKQRQNCPFCKTEASKVAWA